MASLENDVFSGKWQISKTIYQRSLTLSSVLSCKFIVPAHNPDPHTLNTVTNASSNLAMRPCTGGVTQPGTHRPRCASLGGEHAVLPSSHRIHATTPLCPKPQSWQGWTVYIWKARVQNGNVSCVSPLRAAPLDHAQDVTHCPSFSRYLWVSLCITCDTGGIPIQDDEPTKTGLPGPPHLDSFTSHQVFLNSLWGSISGFSCRKQKRRGKQLKPMNETLVKQRASNMGTVCVSIFPHWKGIFNTTAFIVKEHVADDKFWNLKLEQVVVIYCSTT